jgi:hypothetical protein
MYQTHDHPHQGEEFSFSPDSQPYAVKPIPKEQDREILHNPLEMNQSERCHPSMPHIEERCTDREYSQDLSRGCSFSPRVVKCINKKQEGREDTLGPNQFSLEFEEVFPFQRRKFVGT